jgi:hypothetical protein
VRVLVDDAASRVVGDLLEHVGAGAVASGPKLSKLMYSQAQTLSPECSALISCVMSSKLSMVEAARQMRSP